MKTNIFQKKSNIMILLAFLSLAIALGYSTGREIISDFRMYGIGLVIADFALGFVLVTALTYFITKLNIKFKNKEK